MFLATGIRPDLLEELTTRSPTSYNWTKGIIQGKESTGRGGVERQRRRGEIRGEG